AARSTERLTRAFEDRLAVLAHRRDHALELAAIDAHARTLRVFAEAPDLGLVAAPVDGLDHAAVPVDAELERERARTAPVDQALELRREAEPGQRRALETSDGRVDTLDAGVLGGGVTCA